MIRKEINMFKFMVVVFVVALLSACSSKEMYRFGQDYQKSDCAQNVISLEQYDQCMKSNQVPYEDYQKEREAVVRDMSEENKEQR
jgi:uncharacterized lipoprotein